MTRGHIAKLLTALVMAAASTACLAQDISTVTAALDARDLTRARTAARTLAKDAPSAIAFHVLGVLEVATGNPAKAAEAFQKVIEASPQNVPSGLEGYYHPGHPLYRALSRQKTLIALGLGPAPAHNNRGAALVLQNEPDEAFKSLDVSAVTASEWGVPWANGAMAWQLKNNPARAAESARRALSLGERSPQAFTALAEAETELGLMEAARDSVEKALQVDPDYPYALLARYRIAEREGRGREAQRALAQALSNGMVVAVNSNFDPAAGEGNGFGGDTEESHLRLFHHGLVGDRFGYRLRARTDRLKVESRADAKQTADQVEAAVSGTFGTVHLHYLSAYGRRPGLEDEEVGIPRFPSARFDFENTYLTWQRSNSTGGGGVLTLHAAARHSRVQSKMTTAGPMVTPLRDDQTWLEARWDRNLGFSSGLTVGLAHSRVKRTGVGGTPIEPVEQIFTNGTTNLLTGYALVTTRLMDNVALTYGAVAGQVDGTLLGQPVANLAVRLAGARTVHFTVKPRINDAGTNLMPLAFIAETPQRNIIDRLQFATVDQNADPTFLEPTGRLTSYELMLSQRASERSSQDTILFYRTLTDFRTQGSDPRLAPDMILTSHNEGWAFGLRQRARQHLGNAFSLRGEATLQTSYANYVEETYLADDFPAKVPARNKELPNFPRFQVTLGVDWTRGGTELALEYNHVGERQYAVTVNESGNNVAYLWKASPVSTVNLHFRQRIGGLASIRASVFNLGRASFYEGYGAGITAIAGFDYRF